MGGPDGLGKLNVDRAGVGFVSLGVLWVFGRFWVFFGNEGLHWQAGGLAARFHLPYVVSRSLFTMQLTLCAVYLCTCVTPRACICSSKLSKLAAIVGNQSFSNTDNLDGFDVELGSFVACSMLRTGLWDVGCVLVL